MRRSHRSTTVVAAQVEIITVVLFPGRQAAGRPERSSCSRYELDLVQNLSAVVGTNLSLDQIQNLSVPVHLSDLKQEGCKDGWTYSTEYYQSTVVTEVLNCYCCHGVYYCIV